MTRPTDEQRWAYALGLLEPGEALAVRAGLAGDDLRAASGVGAVPAGPGTAPIAVRPDPLLDGEDSAAVTVEVPCRTGWRPVLLHHGDAGLAVLHPDAPERFVPIEVFPGGDRRELAVQLPDDGVVQLLLVPPDAPFEAPGPGAWRTARDRAFDGDWPAWWLGKGVG